MEFAIGAFMVAAFFILAIKVAEYNRDHEDQE